MTAPGVTALVVSAGVLVVLAALGWNVASKKQTSDVAPGADVAGSLKSLQEKRLGKTSKSFAQTAALTNQLESKSARDATVRP